MDLSGLARRVNWPKTLNFLSWANIALSCASLLYIGYLSMVLLASQDTDRYGFGWVVAVLVPAGALALVGTIFVWAYVLKRVAWARTAAFVLSAIQLTGFPIGTAIGAIQLVALTVTRTEFERRPIGALAIAVLALLLAMPLAILLVVAVVGWLLLAS